jgi:ABC-2 type transport system permease protein
VYLLTGIVLFGFFSEGTGNAVTSLVERETLLRKVRFPRMVVPLSVVLTALFNLGMNLVAVCVFLLASGITPMVSWLEMPILVAILVALTTGLALLLAPAYVRFRDVSPIWDVVSQMLFYGSPIFYTVAMYGEFSEWMARTPLPALLTEMRHALIDPDAPSAAEAAGGAVWLLLPLGITGAILVAGILLFRRAAPRLAERL